jgi:hypothetical protein
MQWIMNAWTFRRAGLKWSGMTTGGTGVIAASRGSPVGRIFTSLIAPKDAPWVWSLAHAHVSNRRPTSGTAATCDEAMAAFAKS